MGSISEIEMVSTSCMKNVFLFEDKNLNHMRKPQENGFVFASKHNKVLCHRVLQFYLLEINFLYFEKLLNFMNEESFL